MLNKIIQIVKDAAQLMHRPYTVMQKGGCENIVTSADIAVQSFLMQKLSELLPDSAFICEEGDVHDTSKQYTWIIDPIDGTANFARQLGQSAISVALQHDGKLHYGVVYNPSSEELYTAEAGKGAYCNGTKLSVSDRKFNDAMLCTALCLYHKHHSKVCNDIIYETYMQCNDFRRFGSCALELCYLAAGKCDLYFEICIQPWDYAAAQLVLEEAGGILTSSFSAPLHRDKPVTLVGANNAENHAKLCEIVDRHLKINNTII